MIHFAEHQMCWTTSIVLASLTAAVEAKHDLLVSVISS